MGILVYALLMGNAGFISSTEVLYTLQIQPLSSQQPLNPKPLKTPKPPLNT